jgi:hypothetical protein
MGKDGKKSFLVEVNHPDTLVALMIPQNLDLISTEVLASAAIGDL